MNTNTQTRAPAVAGQFYTKSPEALRDEVTAYIAADSTESAAQPVRGLISPHAGYRFSGAVAGKTFATIARTDTRFSRVVILAPSHQVGMDTIALAPHDGFETPLGTLTVAKDTCADLVKTSPDILVFSERAHAGEHSLEVQLPFIQTLMPEVEIVPAICGQMGLRRIAEAATALAPLWTDDTLWVVSSDFTHYGFSFGYTPFTDNIPERIRQLDMGAVEKIKALDAKGFFNYVEETGATICGRVPITLFLTLAAQSNAELGVELVDYTTSGELTGDFSHTVSYAGLAVFDTKIHP